MKRDELRARVPFEPLERFIATRHPDPDDVRQHAAAIRGSNLAASWVAEVLDIPMRAVARLHRGIDYFEADVFATRLGVHPSTIWSNWWTIEVDEFWRSLREETYRESLALREQLVS